jgi:phosphatidylserine/phosphatidylglycerophosphate/cardiolipin synthase-like enzyme
MKFREQLGRAIHKNIQVAIMTRPCEDFKEKDRTQLSDTLDILRNDGVNLLFKSGVHQKFAVIDERIVWYGSINLLSFGTAEETMMRLESSNIASELLKSVGL